MIGVSPSVVISTGERYCRGSMADISSTCDDVNRDQQYGRGSTGMARGHLQLAKHVHNESSASGQAPEEDSIHLVIFFAWSVLTDAVRVCKVMTRIIPARFEPLPLVVSGL